VKLRIELDREPVAPGHELTGRVVALEGGLARSLTLGVGFVEQSPGDRVAALDVRGLIHEGELASGDAVAFRYALPEWALPSVKARHCELFWELEAVVDRQGPDIMVRRRFEVAAAAIEKRNASDE
jgi:hypothetical protein